MKLSILVLGYILFFFSFNCYADPAKSRADEGCNALARGKQFLVDKTTDNYAYFCRAPRVGAGKDYHCGVVVVDGQRLYGGLYFCVVKNKQVSATGSNSHLLGYLRNNKLGYLKNTLSDVAKKLENGESVSAIKADYQAKAQRRK